MHRRSYWAPQLQQPAASLETDDRDQQLDDAVAGMLCSFGSCFDGLTELAAAVAAAVVCSS